MKNNYCSQCGTKQEEKTSLKLGDDLKVTHYRNGDPIPLAISNEQWKEFGRKEIGAYSITEEGNYLYNWYAVGDSRNIAPKGWRVPTNEEWNELEEELKENQSYTGYRNFLDGNYFSIGYFGYFWSSSEYSSNLAWYRILGYNSTNVRRSYDYKHVGFSVRCVKDGE